MAGVVQKYNLSPYFALQVQYFLYFCMHRLLYCIMYIDSRGFYMCFFGQHLFSYFCVQCHGTPSVHWCYIESRGFGQHLFISLLYVLHKKHVFKLLIKKTE